MRLAKLWKTCFLSNPFCPYFLYFYISSLPFWKILSTFADIYKLYPSFMDEITLNMLTALTDACEGHLVLNYAGIESATSDDNLHITVRMQDGRTLQPYEVDVRALSEAIQHWREEHPGFFQRILGAMM